MERTVQATQSGTASGTWRRTEQFPALRYVSQHQDQSAQSCSDEIAAEDWTPLRLTRAAGELLRAMRLCNESLTQREVTPLERARMLAELHLLKAKSWALMDRFWRMTGAQREIVPEPADRMKLEQGAAGWIAC
jgi:hypothetical protein